MTEKEKIERLKELTPESEFRMVLKDLLRKVGFKNVEITHRYGTVEFGKDIIASLPHPIEDDEWYAFVVKVGRISGNTGNVEEIKGQVSQAFEFTHKNENGEEIRINKVKVVSNENITEGAIRAFHNSLEIKENANVEFWKRDKIIELIDDHYPKFWNPEAPAIIEYCSRVKSAINKDFKLKSLGSIQVDDTKAKKLLNLFIEPTLIENQLDEKKKEDEQVLKQVQIKLKEIIQSEDNFLVTGEPGTGKTRLVDQVAKFFSNPRNASEFRTLPVTVSVKKLKEHNYSLEPLIENQFKELVPNHYERLNNDEFTKLILIDSIDFTTEEERERIIDSLDNFSCNDKCRFIIAARFTDGFDFENFVINARNVKISNFNFSQVEDFITHYFDEDKKQNRFLTILKESNLLNRIPTNPLTLSLLSMLYESEGHEIPATQTDIYNDFTNILLGKLELKHEEELLSLNLKSRIISVIALDMLVNSNHTLQLNEFQTKLNSFLNRKGYNEQNTNEVKSIIHNAGFLYIDEQMNVGFKHDSFIEYFASEEIYDHQRETYRNELINRFNDPHWQNTAVFFAGRSKDMPAFLNDLIEQMPNDAPRDIGSNIGGLGYLGQALYLTDLPERKKLIYKALDNSFRLFEYLKETTADKKSPYYNNPIQILAMAVSYWFNFNFRSITLVQPLKEVYSEIVEENDTSISDFETGFKLFLIASTLIHKYVDDWEKFDDLMDRKCFYNDPVLMVAGDMYLDFGEISIESQTKEHKQKLRKKIQNYRKLLIKLIKEPAYKFDDQYRLKENIGEES